MTTKKKLFVIGRQINNIMKFKSLRRTSKIKIYESVIRPILMHECELRCSERKILRNIYGLIYDPNSNQRKHTQSSATEMARPRR